MDDWLDRMNRLEEQSTRNIQAQLLGTYGKLREAKELLSDLELDKGINPDDPAGPSEEKTGNIRLGALAIGCPTAGRPIRPRGSGRLQS